MLPEYRRLARASILFSNVPDDVADSLLTSAFVRHCNRGATIFLQGEQATAIYIVLDGWVKLYRSTPNGAEAIVGVFTKGRSFGEAVALRNDIYPVTAEAVTDCTVLRIDAAVILRLIRERPEAAVALLSATFVHLHGLLSQVEALKARTGAQRLAEFLIDLAPCETGPCTVTLPYDKSLIAGRLGMKPESLSRAFARLRREGLSIRQSQADIADVAHLRAFVEDDQDL